MSERARVLLVAAAAGVLVMVASSRPWMTVVTGEGLTADRTLHPTGGSLLPVVPATGLVALAAVLAVATARRVGRLVAAVALVLAGAGAAVASLRALTDPVAVSGPAVVAATGRIGAVAQHADVGTWPVVAEVAGVLAAAAGVWALVRARSWQGLAGRYDAPAAPPATTATSEEVAPIATTSSDATGEPDGAEGTTGAARDGAAAWDALDRGEDPTVDGRAAP